MAFRIMTIRHLEVDRRAQTHVIASEDVIEASLVKGAKKD